MKKEKPVRFSAWEADYYTLGIFCQKAGCVGCAVANIKRLRQPTPDRLNFLRGIKEAGEASWADIAYEVGKLRSRSGQRFDGFIMEHAGWREYVAMKEALERARDWETPEQRQAGREIMDTMFRHAGSQRESSHSFATDGYPCCYSEAVA